MFSVLDCHTQGAKCLAEGLCVNRTLTWLGLGKNFLGVEGAWALSDGLRANRGLQWLAVGGNSIGDRGVTHLATLVSGKSLLQSHMMHISLTGKNPICISLPALQAFYCIPLTYPARMYAVYVRTGFISGKNHIFCRLGQKLYI